MMDTHDIINLRHALMLSSALYMSCRLRFLMIVFPGCDATDIIYNIRFFMTQAWDGCEMLHVHVHETRRRGKYK